MTFARGSLYVLAAGFAVAACSSNGASSTDAGHRDAIVITDVPTIPVVDAGEGDVMEFVDDAGEDTGPIADAGCTLNGCAGQCLLGRCVYVIASAAAGAGGAAGVVAQGGMVYWTVPGSGRATGMVLSKSTTPNGSNGTLWATAQDNPMGIVATPQSLYWANASLTDGNVTGELFSAKGAMDAGADSGPTFMLETVASGELSPSALAADGTDLYWAVTGDSVGATGAIMRAPLAGGAPSTLVAALDAPVAVAVDADAVYWAETGVRSGSGAIRKLAKTAHALPVTLVSGRTSPLTVALGGDAVYWAEAGPGSDAGVGSYAVLSVPKSAVDAGGSATLIQGELELVGGMTSDTTSVYWTVGGGDNHGYVMSAPIAGGKVVTMADHLGAPAGIAVDATSVYWVDSEDGSVTSLTPK